MKNHVYNTVLDLGVLNEQPVEVFYDWHEGRTTVDAFEAPDPSSAKITSIIVWLDGKEVDLRQYLNDDLIFDLEYECTEAYLG